MPTAAAQAGNYTYCVDNKAPVCTTNTINVLQFAQNAGLDNKVNNAIDLNYNLLKTSYQYGTLSQVSSQFNTQTLTFATPLKTKRYYPSARLDYTLTKKLSFSLSGNMSKTITTVSIQGNGRDHSFSRNIRDRRETATFFPSGPTTP